MVDTERQSLLQNNQNTAGQKNYKRLILGLVVLVWVDILWVASAELSDFIFHHEGFDKPFFTTYFKNSAFVLYLPGVWLRSRCFKYKSKVKDGSNYQSRKDLDDATKYVEPASEETDGHEHPQYSSHDVSGSDMSEKLPVVIVMKLALMFSILWFMAIISYQEALVYTSPAAVNILSSSSGLFTLILAAIFQSSHTDRFTYSKLLAVMMSITGIVLVTLSDSRQTDGGVNYGALFSLAGAIFYSSYLVLLKRKVPNEEQLDIATFFGFIGLFNALLLWPVFWLLHITNIETFELPPTWQIWSSLVLNAVFGTVLADYLWLWGCYLTSSLSATLALGMTMPLTMVTDILRGRVHLSLMFVLGFVPVFVSFFGITYLCHYENWDPVKTCILSVYHRLWKPCCRTPVIN